MPTSIDTHLLTVLLVVALVAWRVYARIRRAIGRQRLPALRPWITVVVFPLIALGLLLASAVQPMAAAALIAGAVVGIALGRLGTRLTKFEATPAGLFYTPNAHLGIALSMLLVLRLGYRFVMLQMTAQPLAAQSMQAGSPLTLAIFGTLAGYYATYAIGLLRWRAQATLQPPAEH